MEQEKKIKILKVIIMMIIVLVTIIGGYLAYNNFTNVEENQTNGGSTQLSADNPLVINTLNSFRIIHNFCDLDESFLSDIYSGNFIPEDISDYSLILLALIRQNIPGPDEIREDGVTVRIADLNFALDRMFLNSRPIKSETIKENLIRIENSTSDDHFVINSFRISNITNDDIVVFSGAFGCGPGDGRFFRGEIINAKMNGNYLYIDEKIGFGFEKEVEGDNFEWGFDIVTYYFANNNARTFAEAIKIDIDDGNSFTQDSDTATLFTYRHTFKLVDGTYKLISVLLID